MPLFRPSRSSKPVIVSPASAARICTPGAVTSGLSRSKLPAGPRELKAANASAVLGSATAGNPIIAVASGFAQAKSRSASPSAMLTPNTGTTAPGTEGISPGVSLLATTTAMAPAAAALLALSVNGQLPRRTTAIAPSKVPSA